jgi:hypothetical protein
MAASTGKRVVQTIEAPHGPGHCNIGSIAPPRFLQRIARATAALCPLLHMPLLDRYPNPLPSACSARHLLYLSLGADEQLVARCGSHFVLGGPGKLCSSCYISSPKLVPLTLCGSPAWPHARAANVHPQRFRNRPTICPRGTHSHCTSGICSAPSGVFGTLLGYMLQQYSLAISIEWYGGCRRSLRAPSKLDALVSGTPHLVLGLCSGGLWTLGDVSILTRSTEKCVTVAGLTPRIRQTAVVCSVSLPQARCQAFWQYCLY